MKLLCFGDSITWGAWDPDGGWVARMRKRIDERVIASDMDKFVLTYNLGISSDTSNHVLERMPSAIKSYSYEEHEYGFVISLGTNDSIWLREDKQHWIAIDEFIENMTQIVTLAREYTDKVILLGSAPVDETKTHPYVNQDDIESSNADIRHYEEAMGEVAEATGVQFVPVFDQFAANDPQTMLHTDGVHPNGDGHQFIADLVWPYVEKWID